MRGRALNVGASRYGGELERVEECGVSEVPEEHEVEVVRMRLIRWRWW